MSPGQSIYSPVQPITGSIKPRERTEPEEPPGGLSESSVDEAYRLCQKLATQHYENFPVGSLLAPRTLRRHIHAIYAFARVADDFADEGKDSAADRLANIDRWQEQLDLCYAGNPKVPLFLALADSIERFALPKAMFDDLLTAFRMDVTTTSFDRFEDLLFYSSKSANPVGRLVLAVFGCSTQETVVLSDNLCTGLQLANFWQDVAIDIRKGRMYLPLDDVDRFGYTKDNLRQGIVNDAFRKLMEFQVHRTRTLFAAASPITGKVTPRLGLELRLTWNGGMTILRKIEQSGYDVLRGRPTITTGDKLRILATALFRTKT